MWLRWLMILVSDMSPSLFNYKHTNSDTLTTAATTVHTHHQHLMKPLTGFCIQYDQCQVTHLEYQSIIAESRKWSITVSSPSVETCLTPGHTKYLISEILVNIVIQEQWPMRVEGWCHMIVLTNESGGLWWWVDTCHSNLSLQHQPDSDTGNCFLSTVWFMKTMKT